jgi:hypothetical protein
MYKALVEPTSEDYVVQDLVDRFADSLDLVRQRDDVFLREGAGHDAWPPVPVGRVRGATTFASGGASQVNANLSSVPG